MQFGSLLSLATGALRQHRLRSFITIAIIALGIMALTGIMTAIAAINQKLTESFSTMGANGFSIRHKERNTFTTGRNNPELQKANRRTERTSQLNRPLTQAEAEAFTRQFHFPAVAGIAAFAGNRHRVVYLRRQTAPNVYLFGGDQNYLLLNGLVVEAGRNFSAPEIERGEAVCLIGADIVQKLFKGNPSAALNRVIHIDQYRCRIIGTLESRGSAFGFSRDQLVITGYKFTSRTTGVRHYTIGVQVPDLMQVEEAMGFAEGLMRSIRKSGAGEASSFVLERSDSIAERAMKSVRLITISVMIIGLITLTGAAIGLMNILLVAVAERTREIGLLKAIGSKSRHIRVQLFLEAVMLSVAGAVAGVVLGVLAGNMVALLLKTEMVVPWQWLLYGLLIAVLVGILSGVYPAYKAAKLHPIESLRYE